MTPDQPTALHDLAALYALDALPPDEAESFEAHLADCASCTEEVAALQEVAADLSGLTVATPPGDLRASVMAAIDDVAQVPLASEEPDEVVEEPERVVSIRPDATEPASGTTGEAQVVSLAEHRRARWTARVATGVAAALVLVAGALGLWASDLNGQVDELTGQVGDLDQQLVAVGDQLQEREEVAAQVTQVLNAPDAELINETGSSLIRSSSQDRAVFAPGSVPAPGTDEVLQMWVIDDSGATSAGLVEDPTAPTLLEVPVPDGVVVGVTVEPAGGSVQPTSDPIVAFQT